MRGLVIVGALASACGGGERGEAPTAPPVGTLLGALLAAADEATQPWRCAALDVPTLPQRTLAVGDRTWQLATHTLRRANGPGELAIGLVADAAGAEPRTIAALGRLRAAFEAAKLDLVIALGGMGTTARALEATLGTLSEGASWVTVVLPGDLEAMPAHLTALAALQRRGDAILDGRSVRWIELPGVTIATLPGGGAVERLVAGSDGCGWQPGDVVQLVGELTTRPGLRVLATSEAPRQTVDGEATGEVMLSPSSALPVDVVVHGPVKATATPARRGGRDGDGVPLSPGTADATVRLPEAHRPSAGVLNVRGAAWSWRPIVDATPRAQ